MDSSLDLQLIDYLITNLFIKSNITLINNFKEK